MFVAEVVAHGNATRAAENSGYSKRTAHAKGSELLKHPAVAAAIDAARGRIMRTLRVTGERVIEEMATIAFSNIRHFVRTPEGDVALAAGVDESAWRSVRKLKYKTRFIPQKGGDPITEVDTEFELWNKDGQLRNLGEYKKLFKENRTDDEPEDDLTPAQRHERVMGLLKTALERKQQQARRRNQVARQTKTNAKTNAKASAKRGTSGR